jgi:hypothetical protein
MSAEGGAATIDDNNLQPFFRRVCEKHGIVHVLTPAYRPELHGLAERWNLTVMNMANSLLFSARISHILWAAAVAHANLLRNRQYVTPLGYNLLLLNGQATLLPANYPVNRGTDSTDVPINNNDPINWQPVIANFGQLTNGISQLRLKKDNPDYISEIVGTIAQNPVDPSVMLFTVDMDTIPQNSLPPVSAIINPLRTVPGSGLTAAVAGQRYLILEDINAGMDTSFDGADGWKSTSGVDLVAYANDIISYTGTNWQVSWDSTGITKTEYVTNLTTGIQYKWTGTQWQKSYEGEYPAGTWSLVL